MKCILKGLTSDPFTGEQTSFQTEYNGIPKAVDMWASGLKHCFLSDCKLFYADSGIEVPDSITDIYYDRYYYGRFFFDEQGEEAGRKNWRFIHLNLYFKPALDPEIYMKKTGVLIKR